ncbi:FecR family protein [Chitinophaga lutea]
MDIRALYELLEKYRQGNCTPAELEQLEAWYASLGGDRPANLLDEGSEAAAALTHRKLEELRSQLADDAAPVVRMSAWKNIRRWAAVAACLIIVAGGLGYWLNRGPERAVVLSRDMRKEADHDRHILLPDGSTVVLHAGSRLEYPPSFNGATREVTLHGEAYFDVRKDTVAPFIIHSGPVRTTVLGTAFNIKAFDHMPEVTVSVTRGKVKVEAVEGNRLLAVLNPNQQVVYSSREMTAFSRPADLSELRWIGHDMVFEDQRFSDIVSTLSSRYHADIRFEDPALGNCLIRASFNGTEPLEKVLDVLCGVRNVTYTTDEDYNILIKGTGCQ